MINFISYMVILLVAFSIVGYHDHQDQLREQQHYCEMINLWKEYNHLPEQQRPGWPPYKGEEVCHGNC